MKDLLEKILAYLPGYILDLARILSGPKQFVAERNKGTEGDLVKAFTFFGVSLSIFFILQGGFVAPKDFLDNAIKDGILYLIFIAIFSVIIQVCWRIVGGKAEYQRFLITSAYYVGVFSIGLALGSLVFVGILRLLFPDAYTWFVNFLHAPSLEAAYNPDPSVSVGILLAFMAFLALMFLTLVWEFIGWGAYREINQLSRIRSCAALFLTILFSLPAAAALYIMGF